MAVNKVVYGNTTVMDITDTTAEAAGVDTGTYFYTRSGVKTQGTLANGDNGSYGDGNPSGVVPVIPSGTITITQNGVTSVAGYADADVNVPSAINNQNKTVNPSTSQQTVQADSGYTGLGTVTVTAVPTGTVTAPSTISGTTASVSTGTNTITLSKTVSVTPNVTTAGYVSSGTAGNSSVSLSASVTTKGAATITPTGSSQTIASGTYLTGTQTIEAVTTSNLTAANIVSGVTVKVGTASDDDSVASVTGTASGGSGIGTLLTTYTVGSYSTSSTQATNMNKSFTVSGYNNYDALIVETSVNSVTNNRHAATVAWIFLTASTTQGTKDGTNISTAKWNSKYSSAGTATTRASTTAYGIYPYSATISNSTLTIALYSRYNSTQTGTINGSYTTRVYGVNLYNLIGG